MKQTLDNFLTKDVFIKEFIQDYDNFVFCIEGREDCVRVSAQCNCPEPIFANGGQEMLQELYPEYLVDKSETEPRFDLTLRISRDDIPKTLKAGKGKSEEEKQQIREQNEEIRA